MSRLIFVVSAGEHEAADDDGHGEADEVGGEAGDDGVTDLFDADGTEVNGEYVESGLSGAEHDSGGHFEELGGIGSGEDFSEDTERAGAAEGAHEGHGKEINREADGSKYWCQPILQKEKGTGVAEDGECREHGDEEGHDAGGNGEALFGPIDEFFVNLHTAGEGDAEGEYKEEGDGESGGRVEAGAKTGRCSGGFGGGFGGGSWSFGVGAALFGGFDDTGDNGFFEDGLAQSGGSEFEHGDAREGGEEEGEEEFAARGEAGGGLGR